MEETLENDAANKESEKQDAKNEESERNDVANEKSERNDAANEESGKLGLAKQESEKSDNEQGNSPGFHDFLEDDFLESLAVVDSWKEDDEETEPQERKDKFGSDSRRRRSRDRGDRRERRSTDRSRIEQRRFRERIRDRDPYDRYDRSSRYRYSPSTRSGRNDRSPKDINNGSSSRTRNVTDRNQRRSPDDVKSKRNRIEEHKPRASSPSASSEHKPQVSSPRETPAKTEEKTEAKATEDKSSANMLVSPPKPSDELPMAIDTCIKDITDVVPPGTEEEFVNLTKSVGGKPQGLTEPEWNKRDLPPSEHREVEKNGRKRSPAEYVKRSSERDYKHGDCLKRYARSQSKERDSLSKNKLQSKEIHLSNFRQRSRSRERQTPTIKRRSRSRERHMPNIERRSRSRERQMLTIARRSRSRERQMPTIERRSRSRERHMTTIERRSRSRERQMLTIKRRSRSRERQMPPIERRSRSRERQMPTIKRRSFSRERQMPTIKRRSRSRERQTPTIKRRSRSRERLAPAVKRRSRSRERQTPTIKRRSRSREKQPMTTKNRAESRERKLMSRNRLLARKLKEKQRPLEREKHSPTVKRSRTSWSPEKKSKGTSGRLSPSRKSYSSKTKDSYKGADPELSPVSGTSLSTPSLSLSPVSSDGERWHHRNSDRRSPLSLSPARSYISLSSEHSDRSPKRKRSPFWKEIQRTFAAQDRAKSRYIEAQAQQQSYYQSKPPPPVQPVSYPTEIYPTSAPNYPPPPINYYQPPPVQPPPPGGDYMVPPPMVPPAEAPMMAPPAEASMMAPPAEAPMMVPPATAPMMVPPVMAPMMVPPVSAPMMVPPASTPMPVPPVTQMAPITYPPPCPVPPPVQPVAPLQLEQPPPTSWPQTEHGGAPKWQPQHGGTSNWESEKHNNAPKWEPDKYGSAPKRDPVKRDYSPRRKSDRRSGTPKRESKKHKDGDVPIPPPPPKISPPPTMSQIVRPGAHRTNHNLSCGAAQSYSNLRPALVIGKISEWQKKAPAAVMNGFVNGRLTHMVVDKNADVSVIRKDLAPDHQIYRYQRGRHLLSQTGALLCTTGTTEVTITLGGTTFQAGVYVADIAVEFILGNDLMKRQRLILNTQQEKSLSSLLEASAKAGVTQKKQPTVELNLVNRCEEALRTLSADRGLVLSSSGTFVFRRDGLPPHPLPQESNTRFQSPLLRKPTPVLQFTEPPASKPSSSASVFKAKEAGEVKKSSMLGKAAAKLASEHPADSQSSCLKCAEREKKKFVDFSCQTSVASRTVCLQCDNIRGEVKATFELGSSDHKPPVHRKYVPLPQPPKGILKSSKH